MTLEKADRRTPIFWWKSLNIKYVTSVTAVGLVLLYVGTVDVSSGCHTLAKNDTQT